MKTMFYKKVTSILFQLVFLFVGFQLVVKPVTAQDIELANYKFEVDQQGWTLQAYTTIGNPTTNPSSGRIAGVNWAANGGTAGCIRHNIASPNVAGVWFGWAPALTLTAGKQYYVKFGVALSGQNTASINQRIQVRVNTSTNLSTATMIMGSTQFPTNINVPGTYVEYTSPIYTAPANGSYRFAVGDWFQVNGWACYYDGIRIYEVAAPTISTSAISPTTYCPGQSVSVPFTITGTFNAGNTFTTQLSNASGDFSSPTSIGTFSGTTSGTISATIPAGATAGTGYRIRVVSSNPVVNGSDNGSNLTINALPTSTGVTLGSSPICSGNSTTVNANASPGSGTISNYNWSNGTSGSSANPITVSDAGIYSLTVTNSNNCSASFSSSSLTVNICSSTWEGTISNNWNDGSNWSPVGVPNSCAAEVIIPGNTTNKPVLNSAVSVGDIEMQSGASLTLNANLNICGDFTGSSTDTATLIQGSGTAILSGSAQQTISGTSTFNILQINNSNGVSFTSGANVSIYTGLHLQNGNLDVSAGSLRLLSTSATHAAYIDDFTFGATPGTITGTTLQIERFVSVAGRNQHFISSPVNSPSLSQIGASGPDGSYVAPTADCDETIGAYGGPYGTVFEYDDNRMPSNGCKLGNWKIRSAGNMETAQGYSAYLVGNNIITLTGSANTGDKSGVAKNADNGTVNTKQGQPIHSGWNLVGNPYPSTISITNNRPGFDNQVQIWATTGPFAGSWITKIIGQGVIEIAPFQAFMVKKSAPGNGSYPFYQSERIRETSTRFYSENAEARLEMELNYNGLKDATVVQFRSEATNGFDSEYDANKPGSAPGRATLYTHLNTNMWYAINNLPSLSEAAAVPMGLRPDVNGTMSIAPQGIQSFDPTTYIFLEDKKANVWHNLRNGAYTFTTNATDNQDRFVVHFTPAAKILVTDAGCSGSGMINIEQPGSANWNYMVTDQNSTTISSGTLNSGNPVIVNANAGVYSLTLTDNNGYVVMKNIEVRGYQSIVAVFTASHQLAKVQDDITFSFNNPDATIFEWNFGDGTTANSSNVTHRYAVEGVYMVSLTVMNATGCKSVTTQTVTITSREATGLTNIRNPNPISIWSEKDKVYVDFTQQKQVEADIELYNVLGQVVSREKFGNSSIYSKQLNNLEAAYIIVRVKNEEAVTTKKVYIGNK